MSKKPAEYRLAPEAERDLEAIWLDLLEQWGLEQANRYTDELTDVFARLAVGPQLGTACDHIRIGYRHSRVGRHVVYYRMTDYGIDVIRILRAIPRIGLALSGGGFRASIFHLGVIRRLEELGVMKYVHTISAVSGGSIIAAYYVIEMEKRLRRRREELAKNLGQLDLDKARLQIFEEIAGCFFLALDHNLRSRALIFSPFYHPLLWIKSLWPTVSRSQLMQKEYDKWFYHDATLDHLPAVTLRNDKTTSKVDKKPLVLSGLTGPTVVLNTTSLLTGERKGFKREPISGLAELHRVNRNVLKLSRVVGASSGVPGLFPPTTISGDKLVDGGVSDNQGIDALVSLDRAFDRLLDSHDSGEGTQSRAKDECGQKGGSPCKEGSAAHRDDFDVLLVSDASGQMELKHRLGTRSVKVLSRVVSIFQFQLRRKILRILRWWKKNAAGRCGHRAGDADCEGRQCREFAFVHLFLNLKDRCTKPPRVPSEYIPALGGIRTDLDQFSPIEREALMYHGYTLIDAQIEAHCKRLTAFIRKEIGDVPQLEPPLFGPSPAPPAKQCAIRYFLKVYRWLFRPSSCGSETKLRKRVKAVLTAGSGNVFLFRSRRKYPYKSWLVFGPALLVLLDGWGGFLVTCRLARWVGSNTSYLLNRWGFNETVQNWLESLRASILQLVRWLSSVMSNLMPDWVAWVWKFVVESCCFRLDAQLLTGLIWYFLWFYVVLFVTYTAMRWMVSRWDFKDYRSLTGSKEPADPWTTKDGGG